MVFSKEVRLTELPDDYQASFEESINLKGKLALGEILIFKKGMQPYEKGKANAIQQLIDKTDKEIDEMVYQLYGLTEEEIKVVELN